MNRRAGIRVCAAAALLVLGACGNGEQSGGDIVEGDRLRAAVVNTLDFPPAVFDGWEITDAVDRPTPDRRTAAIAPAIIRAAGADPADPPADAHVSPDGCAATTGFGDAAWKAANGSGDWAGEIGVEHAAEQLFSVDVSEDPGDTLDAVTRFVERCGSYTYTTGGTQVDVVTTLTDSEILRYGLNDLRMFTTTATPADPAMTYSSLIAVGIHNGRVVSAQFTAPGTIEGPVINVAGNWWTITATKFAGATAN